MLKLTAILLVIESKAVVCEAWWPYDALRGSSALLYIAKPMGIDPIVRQQFLQF
jgi:hypothetical protein